MARARFRGATTRILRVMVFLFCALTSFGLAWLMFAFYEHDSLPPSRDQLEVVISPVNHVEEVRELTGRAVLYYLDVRLEGREGSLRYYDSEFTRRRRILQALEEDGEVELWVVKPSARRGLSNDVWEIRKGDSLLVSYDEVSQGYHTLQVLLLSGTALSAIISLAFLYKALRSVTAKAA